MDSDEVESASQPDFQVTFCRALKLKPKSKSQWIQIRPYPSFASGNADNELGSEKAVSSLLLLLS
jgi:hypothetical protein